jgi:hypothetical protein
MSFACAALAMGCVLYSVEVLGSEGATPRLRVSGDGRHLVTESGRPFFYLGDTAWELFHRLNREEAALYLENRARKGFRVIQCFALAELDGLKTPNAYGHLPLIDNDPVRPDVKEGEANDYWDHVDFIVNKAAGLGLYLGLLPTWGDKWQSTRGGAGPVIFNVESARTYGRWLGGAIVHARSFGFWAGIAILKRPENGPSSILWQPVCVKATEVRT